VKGFAAERDTYNNIAKFIGKKFDDLFVIDEYDKQLSAAVRKEIMTRNPVSKTTPINIPYEAGAYHYETQTATLLNALDTCDFHFKIMITTLLFTGMRGGKLTRLKWANVDLDKDVIYVAQRRKARICSKPRKQRQVSVIFLFRCRSLTCSKSIDGGKTKNGLLSDILENIPIWCS
jgi:integrase